jgi:hypothetical protein
MALFAVILPRENQSTVRDSHTRFRSRQLLNTQLRS